MAIEYVEGNLVESGEEVVIHGCNALGKFGKGFALAVKQSHPAAYRAYMNAHENGGLIVGSVVWAYDGRLIGNAITQPTYGRTGQHVSYEAVEAVMRAVEDAANNGIPGTPFRDGFTRVSMPLIGSALGGGDWSRIESIIDRILITARPVVYVLPGNVPSASELAARM